MEINGDPPVVQDTANSLRIETPPAPRTTQTRQLMHELASVPSIDGQVPENSGTKIRPHTTENPLKIKSREPGFAFLKGPMPRSCLSVVTGTTGADVTFRRVLLKNGEEVIISFGSEKTTSLPKGAKYIGGWGQSQVFIILMIFILIIFILIICYFIYFIGFCRERSSIIISSRETPINIKYYKKC
jgi:hypothetical protein